MSPTILSALVALLAAFGTPACSEDEAADADAGTDLGVEADLSLGEQLAALGLPAGEYAVESSDTPVCVATFRYPGGATVVEEIGLSGFETFELRVSGDALALVGAYDELSAAWDASAECVIFDLANDTITNHSECEPTAAGADAPCTPFDSLRFCAGTSAPTLAARVPECGEHRYDVSAASE